MFCIYKVFYKTIFKEPLDLIAAEPDEIVQKGVDSGNDESTKSTSTPQGKKRSLSSTKSQNKSRYYSATDEALAIMRGIQRGKSVRDLYTLFGEQVGMQIRGLPTAYSRKVVRQIINTVLFDAEMGKYDSPPSTSSQPYPTAHMYLHSPNSGVPMYTHLSTPIPSNPTFRTPFQSSSQVSTPLVSSASITNDPGTSGSDSIEKLSMEI